MNYIVIDLEWNQNPQRCKIEFKLIPFEIIEIGAIKLDEQLNIIDEFHELIKPDIYQEIHYKTKEITQVKIDDLRNSRMFTDVARDFLQWCGENFIFCTWGSMDLMELQRNLKYFNVPY